MKTKQSVKLGVSRQIISRCAGLMSILLMLAYIGQVCADPQTLRSGDPIPARPHLNWPVTQSDAPFADQGRAGKLVERTLPPKTFDVPIDGEKFSATQIVVKFHEGLGVRVRDGVWVSQEGPLVSIDATKLVRRQIIPESIQQSIDAANRTFRSVPGATVRPIFEHISEPKLNAMKSRGEAKSGKELADLNLYFFILLPKPDPDAVHKIIKELAGSPLVEHAYAQPIPRNAQAGSPDLRASQGYLHQAPGGIDVDFARLFSGGRGELMPIVDVETGWYFDHEDLPGSRNVLPFHGWNWGEFDHGTAVFGEIWGKENSFGVTGIAPLATPGASSAVGATFPNIVYAPEAAIAYAASQLSAGAVILIEQHMPDFTVNSVACINACNPKQCGYVPVELYGAPFAAISTATALGIVVVEAAGNGMTDLDSSSFNGAFNPAVRDSGAILVGANNGSGSLSPACFSNNGARVNVSAWGNGVATLGYGDLRGNGPDVLRWYTTSFNGTSSAAPMVAGAVALIQRIRIGAGLGTLSPAAMRTLLVSTGTPQGTGAHIGPQPDLKAALRATLLDKARSLSLSLAGRTTPAQAITGQVRFANEGPFDWTTTDHQVSCIWLGVGPAITPNPSNLSGPVSTGQSATAMWSTMTPSANGAHTMHCDLVANTSSLASVEATTLVAQPGQFGATIVSFNLPTEMHYGYNGDDIRPVRVPVTIRNTGTIDWDRATLAQLGLRITGGLDAEADDFTNLIPVAAHTGTATVNATFSCIGTGPQSATVQMALGGVVFGSSRRSGTKCLGAIHNPQPVQPVP